MNCVEQFFKQEFDPTNKAIVFFDGLDSLTSATKSITFGELKKLAAKAQAHLKKIGLKRGDSLLLFEEPSIELYALILAALGSGMELLLVEPWLPVSDINHIVAKISPKLFVSKGLGKLVGMRSKSVRSIPTRMSAADVRKPISANEFHVEEMEREERAIMTFTSGTSGKPKGVYRKHGYLLDQGDVVGKYLHYDQFPGMDLTVFTNLVLANLGYGKGSLIIPSSWSPKILKKLDSLPAEFQPDTIACGPGFLKTLMENADVPSLKAFHLGGALADRWIYKNALEKWPTSKLTHVYGSSEAEPVAFCDLRDAIKQSEENNHFQVLYVGDEVEEISLMPKGESLWVAGKHVSPMYVENEDENKKNKWKDERGVVWHNMGDRIKKNNSGLWYDGRAFQTHEEFQLEQRIYNYLGHSKAFLKRNSAGGLDLIGETVGLQKGSLKNNFPELDRLFEGHIYRDRRHRARIDRIKSANKAGIR